MKKSVIFLFLGISFNLFSQFEFPSPTDTVKLFLEDNKLKEVKIDIVNGKSTPLEFTWEEVSRVLNPNWEVQFCDCITCYGDYHIFPKTKVTECTGVLAIAPRTTFSEFSLKVNPKTNNRTVGYLTIKFKEKNNPTNTGNVTYKAYYSLGNNDVGNPINLFKVYPNPTADMVKIAYDLKSGIRANIKVVDITGRLVYESNFNKGNMTHLLSLRDYSNGVYLISLNDETGKQLAVKRVSKK